MTTLGSPRPGPRPTTRRSARRQTVRARCRSAAGRRPARQDEPPQRRQLLLEPIDRLLRAARSAAPVTAAFVTRPAMRDDGIGQPRADARTRSPAGSSSSLSPTVPSVSESASSRDGDGASARDRRSPRRPRRRHRRAGRLSTRASCRTATSHPRRRSLCRSSLRMKL